MVQHTSGTRVMGSVYYVKRLTCTHLSCGDNAVAPWGPEIRAKVPVKSAPFPPCYRVEDRNAVLPQLRCCLGPLCIYPPSLWLLRATKTPLDPVSPSMEHALAQVLPWRVTFGR